MGIIKLIVFLEGLTPRPPRCTCFFKRNSLNLYSVLDNDSHDRNGPMGLCPPSSFFLLFCCRLLHACTLHASLNQRQSRTRYFLLHTRAAEISPIISTPHLLSPVFSSHVVGCDSQFFCTQVYLNEITKSYASYL